MKIAEMRKRAGLTQLELAAKMGVSGGAVAQWETNAAAPTASKLPKLAAILGCTIDELLKEEE